MAFSSSVRSLTVGVLALTAVSASADIVGNFEGLNFGSPSVPSNGQFDPPAAITADLSNLYGGTSGFIVFNLTGLNVTGDATANDSATFRIDVTATGGNLTQPGSGALQVGVTGNGASGISDPSETVTFTYNSGSVTLGDGGTGQALNFIGFRNVNLTAFGDDDAGIAGTGETAIISGGTAVDGTYNDGDTSAFSSGNAFGNVNSFTVGAGNATDNFFVQGLGARIEFQGVVPEPASLALVGLGGLAVLSGRRQSR